MKQRLNMVYLIVHQLPINHHHYIPLSSRPSNGDDLSIPKHFSYSMIEWISNVDFIIRNKDITWVVELCHCFYEKIYPLIRESTSSTLWRHHVTVFNNLFTTIFSTCFSIRFIYHSVIMNAGQSKHNLSKCNHRKCNDRSSFREWKANHCKCIVGR